MAKHFKGCYSQLIGYKEIQRNTAGVDCTTVEQESTICYFDENQIEQCFLAVYEIEQCSN